jgi:hypothetical protein
MNDQANLTPAKPAKLDEIDAFIAVLRRVECEKPKPEDVRELRRLLKSNETNWQLAGDMMQQAQRNALNSINFGKSKTLAIESIEEGMQHIRRQLSYATSPMLEKLLIEQVVTAWLRLSICEVKYSHNVSGESSIQQADYWDRALSASQRRYLRAIETLARVRRLKLPALQVNVAQSGAKQLNVASSAASSAALPAVPNDAPNAKGGDAIE